MWHPTGRFALHHALLPPGLEVLHLGDGTRVLDPLDHLRHGHKVDVLVVLQDLVDPEDERVEEFWVIPEPRGVEVQTQRSPVLLVMSVKVVLQEVVELLT